jgi:hypothetical protein
LLVRKTLVAYETSSNALCLSCHVKLHSVTLADLRSLQPVSISFTLMRYHDFRVLLLCAKLQQLQSSMKDKLKTEFQNRIHFRSNRNSNAELTPNTINTLRYTVTRPASTDRRVGPNGSKENPPALTCPPHAPTALATRVWHCVSRSRSCDDRFTPKQFNADANQFTAHCLCTGRVHLEID